MKKFTAKKKAITVLTPLSAVAAMFALGMQGAQAQTTPVFSYDFPASWDGTGTTITDQSTADNNGTSDGTIALATAVPTGATGESVNTTAGGILTDTGALLNNTAVANAGGFSYDVSFMWNGSFSSSFSGNQKIIDYAGTESLQIVATSGTSATLQMIFGNDAGNVETTASSTTILPDTWYNVLMTFNTAGNSLGGTGDISGLESLYVNGVEVGSSVLATEGTYGETSDRPIGVGQLGANFGYLVGFKGDIYDPTVDLGVVAPEPSSTALLGVSGALAMAWNLRRRKA